MTHNTDEARKSKAKRKRAERKAKHKAIVAAAKARDARRDKIGNYLYEHHDAKGNPTGKDALRVLFGVGEYHREPNDFMRYTWDSRLKPSDDAGLPRWMLNPNSNDAFESTAKNTRKHSKRRS